MTPCDSLDMTRRLVSIPTVSRDSNLPLIEFVEIWLDDLGVVSRRIASDDGGKSNLVATIGPEEPGGVILSGHSDVVPVDGQPWSGDPFRPWVADGRLYGRGTCDMKAFIACALAAVPTMKRLRRPIHLAISYDEEIGCKGAPRMIGHIARELPPVDAVIVGEPTSMGSVTAHKGIVALRTRVTGYETHSSQTHRGVSAVMTAARLVNWLDREAGRLRDGGGEPGFEPPYTTVHVGVIHGGTAINIVSRECEFVWDIRAVPGDNPASLVAAFEAFCRDEVLPEMRRRHPQCAIATERMADAPAFRVEDDCPAVELVQRLTGLPGSRQVAYAAEAGQFQQAGLAAVICGPGSIDQAHQPDEYIDLAQLELADRMIAGLVARQAGDRA